MNKILLILIGTSSLMVNGLTCKTLSIRKISNITENSSNINLIQQASNETVQKELNKILSHLRNKIDIGFGKNYYIEKLTVNDLLKHIEKYVIAVNKGNSSPFDEWSGNIGFVVKETDQDELLSTYLLKKKTSPNIEVIEETDDQIKFTVNVNFINLNEGESEDEIENTLEGTLIINGVITL